MSCIGPVCTLFSYSCFYWLHYQSFFFSWTYVSTAAATGTIHWANLDTEVHTFEASCSNGGHTFWSICFFVSIQQEWTDSSVWTYICTLVTLDAVFWYPFWNVDCDHTFFVTGCTHWEGTVFTARECTYWQFVTLLSVHRLNNFFDECRCCRAAAFCSFFCFCICPACRNFYFFQSFCSHIYSSVVHVNDFVTFFAVGFLNSAFQQFGSFFEWNYVSQFEECSLGNHVDTVFQTNFFRNFHSIDCVELDVVFCDVFFHFSWQFSFQFSSIPWAVQQECAAWFQAFQYIVLIYIACFVASGVVSLVNQVSGTDFGITKTQVRNSYTTGFFRVIREVTLCVHVGVIADDFDCVFVSTNSTVGTIAPEFAADDIASSSNNRSTYW